MRTQGAKPCDIAGLDAGSGANVFNRADIAQVLASDEPLAPTDSPNRIGESANDTPTKQAS